jgi:hypothetical protein
MNWNSYGRKWPWPNLKPCPGFCLDGLRKPTNHLNHDSRCPGRDSNLASPEYKPEALPLEPESNALTEQPAVALPCGARGQILITPLFVGVSATEISFDRARKLYHKFIYLRKWIFGVITFYIQAVHLPHAWFVQCCNLHIRTWSNQWPAWINVKASSSEGALFLENGALSKSSLDILKTLWVKSECMNAAIRSPNNT